MSSQAKPFQTVFTSDVWQSPDGGFKHSFAKLDLNCEQSVYSGVVIVSNEHCSEAVATGVRELRSELPQLVKRIQGLPTVYWSREQDQATREKLLSKIGRHPVLVR